MPRTTKRRHGAIMDCTVLKPFQNVPRSALRQIRPLTDTKRRLERFAQHWQLDETEIAAWSQRAAAATTATHAYSTRVFSAQPIDFVQLEVQVEHHLDDDSYVLDLLFSWHTHTG
jgi:hypothetical protein